MQALFLNESNISCFPLNNGTYQLMLNDRKVGSNLPCIILIPVQKNKQSTKHYNGVYQTNLDLDTPIDNHIRIADAILDAN